MFVLIASECRVLKDTQAPVAHRRFCNFFRATEEALCASCDHKKQ